MSPILEVRWSVSPERVGRRFASDAWVGAAGVTVDGKDGKPLRVLQHVHGRTRKQAQRRLDRLWTDAREDRP